MSPGPYRFDHGVRISGQGREILGGDPLRLIRLSKAGARYLQDLLRGRVRDEPAGQNLAGRLLRAGVLHPVAGPAPGQPPSVSAVVPAMNASPEIAGLVGRLAGMCSEVIVVDDGSSDRTGEVAREAGATVIRLDPNQGPAAARNAGAEQAGAELIFFVDSDCVLPDDHALVAKLASHLQDETLGAVAPRVRGVAGRGSSTARYERLSCPLDMGPYPGLVGPGRRLPYVPSAALLVRKEALAAAGGFEAKLRVGEDVDLVWKLDRLGTGVRFEPEVVIGHLPRGKVVDLLGQRFRYGTSVASLDRIRPRAVVPYGGSKAGLAAAAALPWLGAAGLALASGPAAAKLARSGRFSRRKAFALGLDVTSQSTRVIYRAMGREWLPLTLILALFKGTRRISTMALASILIEESRGRPMKDLPESLAIGLLARAAYSAGAWSACLRSGDPRALLPRFQRGSGRLGRLQVTHPAQQDLRNGAVRRDREQEPD